MQDFISGGCINLYTLPRLYYIHMISVANSKREFECAHDKKQLAVGKIEKISQTHKGYLSHGIADFRFLLHLSAVRVIPVL